MDEIDFTDRKIMTRLQDGLPLTPTPFADIARECGTGEEEFLERVRALKTRGLIRRIGPIIDQRSLGRATTLAATAVNAENADSVAGVICALDGVSHCYLREAEEGETPHNLWFTLSAATPEVLDEILARLQKETGTRIVSFPAGRTFKIRVRFDLAGEDADD